MTMSLAILFVLGSLVIVCLVALLFFLLGESSVIMFPSDIPLMITQTFHLTRITHMDIQQLKADADIVRAAVTQITTTLTDVVGKLATAQSQLATLRENGATVSSDQLQSIDDVLTGTTAQVLEAVKAAANVTDTPTPDASIPPATPVPDASNTASGN